MFINNVVCNVRPGLGLVAMQLIFRGGAKKVIIVNEDSAQNFWIKMILQINGFQDQVEIVERAEDVKEEIDVIFSDFGGSLLMNDKSIRLILKVRDSSLKKHGKIVPNKANLFLIGVSDIYYHKERFDYWSNVYGFKMSSMKFHHLREGYLTCLNPKQLLTNKQLLSSIDLMTLKEEEMSFVKDFSLEALDTDSINALAIWFDVSFQGVRNWSLISSPLSEKKNNCQALFFIEKPIKMKKNERIKGKIGILFNP